MGATSVICDEGSGTREPAGAADSPLLGVRPRLERAVVAGEGERVEPDERGRVEPEAVREVLELLRLRDGVPAAGRDAVVYRLDAGDDLRRGERAVAVAVDIRL